MMWGEGLDFAAAHESCIGRGCLKWLRLIKMAQADLIPWTVLMPHKHTSQRRASVVCFELAGHLRNVTQPWASGRLLLVTKKQPSTRNGRAQQSTGRSTLKRDHTKPSPILIDRAASISKGALLVVSESSPIVAIRGGMGPCLAELDFWLSEFRTRASSPAPKY